MYFPDNKIILESKEILRSKLFLYYLVGFVIIYISPDNVLHEYKFLNYICNGMENIISSITKWSLYSPFPQVTKLYFTYCWISIPFQSISIIKDKKSETKFVNKWNERKQLNVLRLIVLIALTGSLFYVSANYAILDSKPCFVCVNSSKFAQALIGGLIPLINAGMLSLWCWLIKNFRKIL